MADHGHHHHSTDNDHHHHHAGPHGTNYAEANKSHFDATANHAVDPKWLEMAKRSAAAIRAQYDFDEEKTVLMDFACNVGLTSRELAPYTHALVGVDISQGAVDAFNAAASDQGLAPAEMRAVCAELKGEEGELDGQRFDVITCVLSYHHFEDITAITRTLAFFLKPGGALLVVDITKGPASGEEVLFPESHHHVVPHTNGMSEGGMRAAFEGAGLGEFVFSNIGPVKTPNGKDAILFIAKAVKVKV